MNFQQDGHSVNLKDEVEELRKTIFRNPHECKDLIDAMLAKCEGTPEIDDWVKAEIYHLKGVVLYSSAQYTEAIKWYEKAVAVRKKSGETKGEAISLNNIGLAYLELGKISESLEYLQKSLTIKKTLNDYQSITATLENMGTAYKRLSNIPKASEMFYESLHISEKHNDTARMAFSYMNIGTLYESMGDYTNALKMYDEALKANNSSGDIIQAIKININIGNSLERLKNYKEAIKYFENGLKMSEKNNFHDGIIASLNNLALAYTGIGKLKESIVIYRKSLAFAEKDGDINRQTRAIANMGSAYFQINELDKALEMLKKALKQSIDINYLQVQQDCYELLSKVYEKQNNPVQALENYKLHDSIKDKILNVENSKVLNELKERYEADKREQENEINRLKNIELKEALDIVTIEKQKSDKLLLNILPEEIAEEMKMNGRVQAQYFESVSVMFMDIKNFTQAIEQLSPHELVELLDFYYSSFDDIIGRYDVEKIKTIGDAYLCVSGLPKANTDNALILCDTACEIAKWLHTENVKRKVAKQVFFNFRFGIHTGPIIAGIVGKAKYEYDIWGDTVNTAARMEQNSEMGRINISGITYEHIKEDFDCQYRGKIVAKNKGEIDMYYIVGRK